MHYQLYKINQSCLLFTFRYRNDWLCTNSKCIVKGLPPFFTTRPFCENMVTVFSLSLTHNVESRLARIAAAFHVDSSPPCYFCLLTSGTGSNYINAAVAAGDVMRLCCSANYSPCSPETKYLCKRSRLQWRHRSTGTETSIGRFLFVYCFTWRSISTQINEILKR